MATVFRIGEKYSTVCGPERDQFLADLLEFRETTEDDITLDFEGVRQLNSIALAAIGKMHIWMESRGRVLSVCHLNRALDKTFRITGLSKVLHITQDGSLDQTTVESCPR